MLTLLLPVAPTGRPSWYGVPVESVREVAAWPQITPLPDAPPAVMGVFNLRGEVIPVLDTASLLDLGSHENGGFVVIVELELGSVALTCSEVPEAAELGESVGPAEGPAAVGCYAVGQQVVTMLDLAALCDPARIEGKA